MDGADWRGKAIPRDPTSAQSEFPPFLKKLRKNDINLLIWNSRYSKYKKMKPVVLNGNRGNPKNFKLSPAANLPTYKCTLSSQIITKY